MADEIAGQDAVSGVAIVEAPCDVEKTSQPFGERWGNQIVALSAEHLLALQQGKCVAVDVQEEYVVFLRLVGRKIVI